MAPVLSKEYTSAPPQYSRDLSVHNSAGLLVKTSSAISSLADANPPSTQDEGVSRDTLRHARIRLDARHYQKRLFALRLLEILRKLRVAVWCDAQICPEDLEISKVSGALTNAVFFVSCETVRSAKTVLLRVYGPSTSSLISRTRELQTLHVISTRYGIGPRVYGTFDNGRIEEYFDSVALTASEIRDPQISRWIAARMAELHSVDITLMDNIAPEELNIDDLGTHAQRFEVARNVRSWFGPAEKVLALPGVPECLRLELDLPKFKCEWNNYLAWVLGRPKTFGMRRVFGHNDAQYGNLLRLKDHFQVVDEHRQIVVVDFEYAGANPAAYDIANHFHEWTTNYHVPSPHKFSPSKYPTPVERRNFYASYINHAAMLADDDIPGDKTRTALSNLIEELDRDIVAWTPASHAGGALWGIVQAQENIIAGVSKPDFDYVGYATGRMAAFRLALKKLGIVTRYAL